jgi:hypothetical protein
VPVNNALDAQLFFYCAFELNNFNCGQVSLSCYTYSLFFFDCPLLVTDSTVVCNTIRRAQAGGLLQMKQRTRIYYTETQKAMMWERWKAGESLHQIARLFDRHHSSVRQVLADKGSIHLAPVVNALIRQARKLPHEQYRSLTWDRCKEMAEHKRFSLATDILV